MKQRVSNKENVEYMFELKHERYIGNLTAESLTIYTSKRKKDKLKLLQRYDKYKIIIMIHGKS